MSGWQIAVTVLLYAWVAVDLWHAGRHGMSVSFLGYAIGNAGILYAVFKGQQ